MEIRGLKEITHLRYLRLNREEPITTTQLGELTGLAQSTISKFDTGKMAPNELQAMKIASALGCPEKCNVLAQKGNAIMDWVPTKDVANRENPLLRQRNNMVRKLKKIDKQMKAS